MTETIAELKKIIAEQRDYIGRLENLCGRLHKATAQFYQEKTPAVDRCPYDDILRLYHDLLPMLPGVRSLTVKRKSAIRERWRHDLPTLADWGNYFTDVAQTPFMHGQNGRGWHATIDFLIREDAVTKMQENFYDR